MPGLMGARDDAVDPVRHGMTRERWMRAWKEWWNPWCGTPTVPAPRRRTGARRAQTHDGWRSGQSVLGRSCCPLQYRRTRLTHWVRLALIWMELQLGLLVVLQYSARELHGKGALETWGWCDGRSRQGDAGYPFMAVAVLGLGDKQDTVAAAQGGQRWGRSGARVHLRTQRAQHSSSPTPCA